MGHPVNLKLVRQRAAEVRESITKVQRYAALPDEAFFADERNLYTVLHLLLIAIEAMAGLCNHLVTRMTQQAPSSYTDCFEHLEALGVIDEALVRRLIPMARFRNLLVHRYWEVDPQRVLRYARENLGDFERFLEQLGRWLGESL